MIPEWNETLPVIVGRWGLVLLTVSLLLVLSAVPLEIAHLGAVRPVFMMMAVYYLAIIHPSLLPPIVVFFAGLMLDLVAAYPLGMNALILVLVQWVTSGQRTFLAGQSFLVIWAGFSLMALAAGTIQWMLFSLFSLTLVSIHAMLISALLSVFLFPVMALVLSFVHKALADHPSSTS